MSLDVYLNTEDGECLYSANITHNLNKMAEAAGIYQHLWRPDELGITKAKDLIAPLMEGYGKLVTQYAEMQQYNSPNGWGLYENFLPFVARYLEACGKYPDAIVEVDR